MTPSSFSRFLAILGVVVQVLACGDDDGGSPDASQGNMDADDVDVGSDAGADPVDAGGDSAEDAAAPAGSFEIIEIPVGDLVFDARVAGPEDGELVLLLHGFPETSYEWRNELEALGEAGYRAVAPDQRGYSPRARPTEVTEYALPLLVQDVLGMADALGVERFHLVGHDWGAIVAWAVGGLAPERIITLTPISVPHPDAFRQVLSDMASCQYMASSYFDLFVMPDYEDVLLARRASFLRVVYAGLPEDAIEEYLRVLGTPEALAGALSWYRANIVDRTPVGPALGNITVPTMFIWSDGDTALCRDGAELTADFVEDPYRFEVIEGVSHWVPELAAERTTALILEHIGGG